MLIYNKGVNSVADTNMIMNLSNVEAFEGIAFFNDGDDRSSQPIQLDMYDKETLTTFTITEYPHRLTGCYFEITYDTMTARVKNLPSYAKFWNTTYESYTKAVEAIYTYANETREITRHREWGCAFSPKEIEAINRSAMSADSMHQAGQDMDDCMIANGTYR